MDEGNILVLDETQLNIHDLIMIVGKEPNNEVETVNRIDKYGENWNSKGKGESCVFWNLAYSVCGHIVDNHACASLKGLCAGKKTSPIIFSDVSPKSLNRKYSVASKKKLREKINENEYKNHINSIFSHSQLIKRVKLVIFAGTHGCGLAVGRTIFENTCDELEIKYRHIASLNSTRHTVAERVQQIGSDSVLISKAFAGAINR